MSLFGLGDFGEGFVTGLADSASDAIQKDMDAVRARIEKLSDFQANKIIKDQEAREEEIRDAMKQLKIASRVFGNDPKAKKYASAILEREGGIEGLNEVVARFKKAKLANPALNLGSYFEQSSEELPDLSFREIASSAIPRRTATAVELPENIASGGAGNLLANIGLDQKISQRVSRDVAEQTAAAGIAPVTDTDITLPSIAFDDEQFLLDTSSVQEGMDYLMRQRALESNTPQRNEELDILYAKKVKYAAESGSDIDAMNGIENQLSRLDVEIDIETGLPKGPNAEKYTQLQLQKQELQFKMDMAKAGTDKKAQLLVQAAYARSKGNTDEAIQFERQAEDIQGDPTYKTIIERAERDLQGLASTSPTYQQDREKLINKIKNAKIAQKKLQDETGIIDLNRQDLTATSNAIYSNFKQSLARSDLLRTLTFTDNIPDWNKFTAMTGDEKAKLAYAEYDKIFNDTVNFYGSTLTNKKDIAHLDVVKENLAARGLYTPTEEKKEEAPVVMPEVKGTVSESVSATAVINAQKKYSDNSEGIDAYIAAAAGKSEDEVGTIDEQVAGFSSLGYSPAFTVELKNKLKAQKQAEIEEKEARKQVTIVDDTINIIKNTSGFKSKEIRAIKSQLNVDDTEANKLYNAAIAEIKRIEQEKQDKRPKYGRPMTEAQLDANPDVVFVALGKQMPYKKIGDDFFAIKGDGTVSKSPVNKGRRSILNAQMERE